MEFIEKLKNKASLKMNDYTIFKENKEFFYQTKILSIFENWLILHVH